MNTLRDFRRSVLPSAVAALVMVATFASGASAGPGQANPAISVQASPSGYPVGSWIHGSAMLGQGNSPTGTITFSLYGPGDPTCASAPVYVSHVPAWGNGYYTSGWYATTAADTYRWTVRYLGDRNNNPTATTSCSDPGAAVTMAKRSPTLRSTASASGTTVTNEATLNGAAPTGTLTFSLFAAGNSTCAGSPIHTAVEPVSGNRSYMAKSFTVPSAGTYRWTVLYSGDANNHAAATFCADPANAVSVSGNGTSPSGTETGKLVTATPNPVRPAEPVTVRWDGIASPTNGDWYAMYAVGAPDRSVVFWRYTGGLASGSATVTVPWGTAPGSYEIRLFANNSLQRLDVSDPIRVS